MSFRLGTPLFVQMELTERCIHRCRYCSNLTRQHGGETSMPLPHIQRCLDQVLRHQVFTLVLTGGEPLTHRQGWIFALEYLQGKSLDVCVNSSVALPLSRDDISALKRASFILISFPSSDRVLFSEIVGANTYDTVVANLEKLSEAEVPFGINQVVTKRNKETVSTTAHFLVERFRIGWFAATPVVPVRASVLREALNGEEIVDLADTLLSLESETRVKTDMLTCIPPCLFPPHLQNHRMSSHGCAAGKYTVVVGVNGLVRACGSLRQNYGSLLEEELAVIWARLGETGRTRNSLCNDCLADLGCEGGCKARMLVLGHDPYVRGRTHNQFLPRYTLLDPNKRYRLKSFRHRAEQGSILISDGESYVLGNDALLEFMGSLREIVFSLQDVHENFGEDGAKVATYLLNRGICEEAM